MKKLIQLALVATAVIFLVACHRSDADDCLSTTSLKQKIQGVTAEKYFLSGTYVVEDVSPYLKVYDTLFIQKHPNSGSLYDIRRSIHFHCYANDTRVSSVVKREDWLSSYDEQAAILYVISKDKRVQVKPKHNRIEMYGISFTKVE